MNTLSLKPLDILVKIVDSRKFDQNMFSPRIPEKNFAFEKIYECKNCPHGHKCGFAAADPVPCPPKEYNSHFNQTTCQECDPYFGEYCPEGSGKFGKLEFLEL